MKIAKLRRERNLRMALALTAAIGAGTVLIPGASNQHNYMPAVSASTTEGPNLLYGLAGLLATYALGSYRLARDAEARLEQAEREAYEASELA